MIRFFCCLLFLFYIPSAAADGFLDISQIFSKNQEFLKGAPPEITAISWLVATDGGEIIMGENFDAVRSIASVTKLMTALVVLEKGVDLDQLVPVTRLPKITTKINPKLKRLTRRELIGLALVSSDNLASYALCASFNSATFDMSMPCVPAMNEKARSLGMTDTVFTEPSGRYASNVSTARDLIKLVQAASQNQLIQEYSDKGSITIQVNPRIKQSLNNTNPLIGKYHNVLVSKTGWTKSSGGCIVMLVRVDSINRVVVVLGSKSTKTRIFEAEIISSLPDREDQDWIYRYLKIER
jgi:D-alanyl-D-alanine endopeptidase (penicillin-binding protein 7)